MYVNGVKIYQFKAKDLEIWPYKLCLGYVSKDFTNDNLKKNGSSGYVFYFLFDYISSESDDIENIHKDVMKKLLNNL